MSDSSKTTTKRFLKRARSRGMSNVSNVMESAMVIGWFVLLIIGEKQVSTAADARRASEDSSESTASKSAANYCQPQQETYNGAQVRPSTLPGGMPNASAVISAIAGLGIGSERTFPNYIKPLQNIEALASTRTRTHDFVGQRELGCLERPLDTSPKGSMDQYRIKIWITNLQGY